MQPGGASSCAPACMRAMTSPAGRGFVSKMGAAFGKDAEHEMVAAIVPDLLIRFGEKAKAAEAKRAAP
jgi:hypothetical protein